MSDQEQTDALPPEGLDDDVALRPGPNADDKIKGARVELLYKPAHVAPHEMPKEETHVNKPKILILVHGGVADYLCIGDVDVQVVDEDNIDAGDPRVELDPEWAPYLNGVFNLPYSKYVYIAEPQEPATA